TFGLGIEAPRRVDAFHPVEGRTLGDVGQPGQVGVLCRGDRLDLLVVAVVGGVGDPVGLALALVHGDVAAVDHLVEVLGGRGHRHRDLGGLAGSHGDAVGGEGHLGGGVV